MAKFDPNLANADLLPEEWFDALIVNAYEKTAKSGNPCIVVSTKIYGGAQPIIDRYYVTSTSGGVSGLRKLCHAAGILEDFKSGELDPEKLKGRSVQALVKVQKDESGQWDDKNVCAQFRPRPAEQAALNPNDPHVFNENDPAMKDDSIPF
jgi:hypothetical protein